MVKPKAKGGAFERKVCGVLSLWVSNMNREDVFYRSSQSGGRATFRAKRNPKSKHQFITQSGDISAIHPLGKMLLDLFMIECKHIKAARFDSLVWQMRGTTYAHWLKLNLQSEQRKRDPMLITKQNQRPIMVGVNLKGLKILHNGRGEVRRLKGFQKRFVSAHFPYCGLYLIRLSDMMRLDFSQIREEFGGMSKRIKLKKRGLND